MALNLYFDATATLSPKTGIGQYCIQLIKEFCQNPDISNHYYLGHYWSDTLPIKSKLPKKISIGRTIAERFPNLSYSALSAGRSIVFKRGTTDFKGVYHAPNFLSYKTKLPTVVTVHDLSILRYSETHPAYRVAIMKKRIPDSINRADFVITDSEYIRKEVISEFNLPPEKVVTTLLSASSNFSPTSSKSQQTILSAYNLTPGSYILAVGTLEPRKNLRNAIKAYIQLPETVRKEIPFVIAGMSGWNNDSLYKDIASIAEQGQIRRLGYIPDEVLPFLYGGASIFVYPSLYEGFGLPPLEAMACGTPVLVSDRSSLPEVVSDAGLLSDPFDIDQMASLMLRVIESSETRRSLQIKGIERAAQFSWKKCADQTIEVYKMALQS